MTRNRHLPLHLEFRKSAYFWRRRLPCVWFSGANWTPLKKSFLCISLRTHVPREAKILAHRLTAMSDMVFAAAAETTMTISPHIQSSLLETLVRFEILAFEQGRAILGNRSADEALLGLQREQLYQSTLRQALYIGDRDIARQPLRDVAAQLGIKLDELDEDWLVLAYEATKVLLDVSVERNRRRQGFYSHPTDAFLRATAPVPMGTTAQSPINQHHGIQPATFASLSAAPAVAPAVASFATVETVAAPAQAEAQTSHSAGDSLDHEPAMTSTGKTTAVLLSPTACAPVVVPAGLDIPDGYDEESWQEARIAARPPRILIDQKLLSEQSRAALKKRRGITFVEAIELYFELLSWGYSAPFNKHQKRKKITADLANGPLEDRLAEHHRSNRRLALDFWPSVLGDEPVDEIQVHDLNDALARFWSTPSNHNKSEKDRAKFNLVELIEKADAKQAQSDKIIAVAMAHGAGSEQIDKMRLNGFVKRISVTTYLRHGRVLRAIGEMLMDMQIIDQNPFEICSWSNAEEKRLKASEGSSKRESWDDRINDLFVSPIFQEPLADVGDPLFWSPLIARHQGMRMEEILQLGPDDFGSDRGIPYIRIQNTIINGVKTLSSERTLPIHPQLIELGLLKLVAQRKKEGHIRLFPFLNRGKVKDTFSSNFSKSFGYYRRTNNCFWPGLDFHALRTTFHHDLLGDDKSDAIRCRLMGHTYTDEGDRSYGQNLKIEKLAERMKSVVVDISMIRRPFDTPAPVVETRAREHGLRVVA
jgi:integrase